MKTLVFLLVLLLQAAPIDPLAGLPAALRQLRGHLDEHRPTFGATAELTAAKHQLRDWVESRLSGLGRTFDDRAFAEGLHTALGKADLLCNDLVDQCDWNFLGYVDDVRVSRADELLVVVTATGIWCGYDESAYVYAWEGRQWRRVWEHERNTYTQSEYLPQTIHDVLISPPDASRARLLMTLGSQTICGGAFKDVYARAWRMDSSYVPARVLDFTAHANDAYPPLQGRVRPDDILFQFTAGGLLSGEVHTAVRHFKIAQGEAIQVDPVAGLPRDFVVEWLTAPWEQSRARSEPASLEASHAQLHRLDGVGDVPDETVRRCTAGSDLWQVGTHLYERPKRFFRVRWRSPYTFTMVGVSETPYPDCTVADPRGETYSNLLAADLR
ncbi:MAG: hypothetical protein ABJA98_22915 [Acidobacteriota bacterium]